MPTRRGAQIYAEIVGYGMSGDAYHITAPVRGRRRRRPRDANGAIARPAIEPGRGRLHQRARHLDAASTIGSRRWPSSARSATTRPRLAMSSTKSMTGHLLGAAGGLEAGITALAVLPSDGAADHQSRRARSRAATSTTCRTSKRADDDSTTRCRIRSGSAAPTPRCCSSATRRRAPPAAAGRRGPSGRRTPAQTGARTA